MAKHGKKYDQAIKLVEADKFYSPEEASSLVKKIAYANFDETVEVHFKLGIDPRHADQQVRSTASLPHGTGKQVRVIVFAEGDAARVAREQGIEDVGSDDLIQRIEGGFIDFDISIAAARVRRQSIPHHRFGLRGPSRMFSATDSSGTRVVSCVTVAIPAARASAASPNAIGSPSRNTPPPSGASCPARIFSRVDLPEPFSPISPWISCPRSSKSTERRALTGP